MRDAHADLMYVRSRVRVFTCVHVRAVPPASCTALCTRLYLSFRCQILNLNHSPLVPQLSLIFFFRLYLIKTNRGENEGQLL